jgi:hypothetical protein
MGAWKLTIRHGSDVEHEEFDDLDAAVGAMRRRAFEIRAGGPVRAVSALRDFEPRDQVQARLELAGQGRLRKPVAGVDVRGNGEFVPYRGRLRRVEMDPSRDETPFELVRETLRRDGQR